MFKEILKKINLQESNGLLLVEQRDAAINETQRRTLYIAYHDYFVDAVFFRNEENNKSVPLFFIYDNTSYKISEDKLIEIHKRLWSSEIVPVYFVFEKAEIKIYNAKQRININDKKEESIQPTDILEISNILENEFQKKKNNYSPFLFENGSFWESDYFLKNYLNEAITKDSPFDILIANLHGLKNDLIACGLHSKDVNRIVVITILIKYLEEKKDQENRNVFTIKGDIFKDKWNVSDFSTLIKNGKLLNLLKYLSSRFNGKIFELKQEEEIIIENLSEKSLYFLSNFVNANYKTKDKQLYLWRLYSFRFLPVELISRIYEEFIPDKAGVVYTPPFLVDLLIDQCMPLDDYRKFENNSFQVIDPSCGSGIFCVSAYQRLIDWHIINKYHKTGVWDRNLNIDTLKKILTENIFGVDKEQEAVNIAVFSLTLALLEKLTPIQLWEDLDFEDIKKDNSKKFKNLKDENIVHANFFEYLQTAEKNFDLVIGNPPFIRQELKSFKKEFDLQIPKEIPANTAILFLDQSIKLLKDNGLQCLILPTSAILYNDGAMKYRSYFMQTYFVPQIIDFTHLRRKLFNKDVATCAFFVKNQKPENNSKTLHLISHRTTNEENKMFFVFDTYDFHFVSLNEALTQKYVWKSNLVGGGRLNWIVERLSGIKPTLGEFLEEKKQKNEWEYLDGYTVGKATANKVVDFITGNYSIPESAFSENGVDYSQIFIEKETKFANKRNELIFSKPQLLIKKTILESGQIPVELIDYQKINTTEKAKNENILCFKDGITGIHFNETDKDCALSIYNFLANTINNFTLSFFSLLTGSVALVRRERAIGKDELNTFPYPQTETDKQLLQLSEIEKIWQEDVFNYYIHQGKATENKGKKNPFLELADINFVTEYADTYIRLMNLNYTPSKEKSFKTERICITQSYIAVEFLYCSENIKTVVEEKTEQEYQNYFEKQIGRNQKITRIVRFVDFPNNKIYFIKPQQKRYWLKSIADRDAMWSFADFGKNKYKKQNKQA